MLNEDSTSKQKGPITIVGGGPVGLLLACLLGQKGKEVRLVEKRTKLPESSMAIGITPPSLDILEKLDLKKVFLEQGVLIQQAEVFESGRLMGSLDFRSSESYILSFPQFGTMKLLEQKALEFANVSLERGATFGQEDLQGADGWVIGCDGAHSNVREFAKLKGRSKSYGVRFIMADFPDHEELGSKARLYFSAQGAVESFPLPGQKRRWVAQVERESNLSTLCQRVHEASGIDLRDRESETLWPFSPQRFLVECYGKDNILLCGDAAHVMSPIGGQGMNTGFADAMMLAEILDAPSPAKLAAYTKERRKAFRMASRRAAMGMWLGTRRGKLASGCRGTLLKQALNSAKANQTLARTFSMRNLPHPFNP